MSVIRLLHGTRSTPVSRLRLGEGLYVGIEADGTHVITTTPTDFGGQTEAPSQVAVEQVVSEWTVLDAKDGDRHRITEVPAALTEISTDFRKWWPLAGLKSARIVANVVEAATVGTLVCVIYSLNNGLDWAELEVELEPKSVGAKKSAGWMPLAAGAAGQDVLLSIGIKGGDDTSALRLGALSVQFAAYSTYVGPLPSADVGFDESGLIHYYESFNETTLNGSDQATQMRDQVSGVHYGGGNPPATEVDATLGVRVLRFLSGTYLELPAGSHSARTAGHIFMLLKSDYQIAAASASGIWIYGPTHERYKSDIFGAADFSYGRTGTVFPVVDPHSITVWHLLEIEAGGGYWAMRTTRGGVTTTHREDLSGVTHAWYTGAIRLGVSSSLSINGFYRMALLAEFDGRQSPSGNADLFRQYVRDLFPAANI